MNEFNNVNGEHRQKMEMDDENLDVYKELQVNNNTAFQQKQELSDQDKDDEDNYKAEGTVVLHIDRFTDFARGEGPGQNQRLSDPVYIRGLPWKILAIPRDIPQRQSMAAQRTSNSFGSIKGLGFFLQCNGDAKDMSWNCHANATLHLKSHKEGQDDMVRKISHQFHQKENDWGFSHFISCEQLLDPTNGWIDENDTVSLSADVNADAPHGVQWDSKKHTDYIGLKNQGATCYMNSILQTLFFTNKLRKAVYQMPTEEDDPESSVALAMQRVFYELQFSQTPVGTKKLTKSFGWDTVDSFLQHDVQELCRVLLDNLESKMKSTRNPQLTETIPQLFKGRMKSYIKCKNIEFESSREEFFYDVQLKVKGTNISNILDSFDDYVIVEDLDGENKYDAGDHGLQPAEKGVRFLSFPPVLHLQLMRFQYDPSLDANVKLNDRLEFSDELNLNKFILDEEADKDDYTYLLYAVLVHSGDFHGGHYVVYLNTNLYLNPSNVQSQQKWCKFDDDVVSRAVHRDAVDANFGGEDPEVGRNFTNAYMLVYVRKNSIEDVLSPVAQEDIPEHLKNRFEVEKKRDAQRKQEKEEASHYCEITIVTDEDFQSHHGFELMDMRTLEHQSRKLKIEKSMTFTDLYKHIASNFDYQPTEFRLWGFRPIPNSDQIWDTRSKRDFYSNYNSDCLRPALLFQFESESNIDENEANHPYSPVTNDYMVYLELGKFCKEQDKRVLSNVDQHQDYTIFIKYFNPERNLTEYKGLMFFNQEKSFVHYSSKICSLIGIPIETKLNFYIELRPDNIFPINGRNSTIPLREAVRYVSDGSILVVESAILAEEKMNAKMYFQSLYNRIEVEVHVHRGGLPNRANSPALPFKGIIDLEWKMPQLCNWIGKEIGYDPQSLLIWKVNQHTEKPAMQITSQFCHFTVREVLSLSPPIYDPRTPRCYNLYYTKLPIKLSDMENYKHIVLHVLGEKFQLSEMPLFIARDGTIGQIIDEAKKEFKFSDNGTGQLRLLSVGNSPSNQRVYQVLNVNQTYTEFQTLYPMTYSLRIEEIPADQIELGPNERLLPVAHFDKEPVRVFGVPFFIKIRNEEKISVIRQRIKDLLEVPEKEFEKYKFVIIANNHIVRELENDDESVVKLSELTQQHHYNHSTAPYLGIDHMNKSRGTRGGHGTEKAIVIHN